MKFAVWKEIMALIKTLTFVFEQHKFSVLASGLYIKVTILLYYVHGWMMITDL
jgi:hypothetical protein